jgi:hypothetical protein
VYSWKKYDENTKIAVIRYDGYEAEVDTTLIQSIPANGDIVQCLGEVLEEVYLRIKTWVHKTNKHNF